jgi:hypothetical protein
MKILLIVGCAEAKTAFRTMRRVAAAGKKVLLLFTGEGCRIASDPAQVEGFDFARLFALRNDCPNPAKGVELVDYDGWIRLLEYCNKTVSWT